MEVQFKPFQKVLVRDSDNENWICNLFSHMYSGAYACMGQGWKQCIPFKGNEHFVGTTNTPIPKYEYKIGEIVKIFSVMREEWCNAVYIRKDDTLENPHVCIILDEDYCSFVNDEQICPIDNGELYD